MKKIFTQTKIYIFRGLFASIPLGLSFFVLKFFYDVIDQKIMNFVDDFLGFRIPGLGILIFAVTLYLIGFLASNIIGKRLFDLIERVSERIPIVKTTYQVGKQISSTLLLPEKQVFKRVVLVDYFRPGVWTIGFVTGTITDKKNNEKLLKVFIPTVPNPTSGMLIILKESQTIDPKWSVEQGMRTVISGGIIGPDEVGLSNTSDNK